MTYHVRRSALPRPGTDEQLQEFVARIQPRPLDRPARCGRSTWSRGWPSGRFAVVTKTHQALVDGINAVDIAHVIVDGDPDREVPVTDTWRPGQASPATSSCSPARVVDAVRRPSEVIDNVRGGRGRRPGGRLARAGPPSAGSPPRWRGRRPAPRPTSPLNVEIGAARRLADGRRPTSTDYRKVRARLGGGALSDEVTVNDVVLATVAGGPAGLAADPRRGGHAPPARCARWCP